MKKILSLAASLLITIAGFAQNSEGGYVEDFEGGHYDGKSFLPIGWKTTGGQPFYTLSWYTLPAHSGNYYAISIDLNYYETSVARNEWMYTCGFELLEGVTYSGSYWIHNDGTNPCDVTFSVGDGQSPETQSPLHAITKSTPDGEWQEMTFEFTPEVTAHYFFAWNVMSDATKTTFVAIDDFKVIQAKMANLPHAEFAIPHIYDISTSGLIAYPGQKIHIDNTSVKAESYEWKVEGPDARFDDATAAEPDVIFNKAGRYTITLYASNESGTVTAKSDIYVTMGNNMGFYGVSTYDGLTDELIQRGTVPTLKTDLDYDFVTGPNHLYREFAERYNFCEGYPVKLHTINVFLTEYNLRTDLWSTQQNVPFDVIVYGETDGMPDETKIFGQSTTTIGQSLGTTGVGGTSAEARNIVLNEPIIINGPAYISFRVGEEFCMDDDRQAIRSYMCFAPIRRQKTSTMKVKPFYLPSGISTKGLELGDWCTAAQLDSELPSALGMYNIAWVSKCEGADGIEDVTTTTASLPSTVYYNLLGQRVNKNGNARMMKLSRRGGVIVR